MYLPFQWLLAMQLLKKCQRKKSYFFKKKLGKTSTVQPDSENSYYFGGETTFSECFDNGDVQGLLFQTSIEIHIKAGTSMSNTGFQNLGSKF